MSTDQRPRLKFETWPAAVYAIGDVHGCLEQLQKLEAMIIADRAAGMGACTRGRAAASWTNLRFSMRCLLVGSRTLVSQRLSLALGERVDRGDQPGPSGEVARGASGSGRDARGHRAVQPQFDLDHGGLIARRVIGVSSHR